LPDVRTWFKLVSDWFKLEAVMRTVGAFEAKTHLSALLDGVAEGEQVVITRHGTPVARLVPAGGPDVAKAQRAAEAMLRARAKHRLAGMDWRELRDEGRK